MPMKQTPCSHIITHGRAHHQKKKTYFSQKGFCNEKAKAKKTQGALRTLPLITRYREPMDRLRALAVQRNLRLRTCRLLEVKHYPG